MSMDPHGCNQSSPELELILCCARTRMDERTTERIHALLGGKLNWPDLVVTAFKHHVASFLYENLRLTRIEIVPTFWLESMRQYTRESSALALVLVSDLLRILEIFEAEKLPLIPYKGPVLSSLAYGNLTGRTFIDLDFVAKQENISRATTLLESAGFSAEFGPQEERAGRTGRAPGQYSFFCKTTRAHVELHTEQTLRYFPIPLDFDKLSRRFIIVEIAGRKMRTFSVEDTLVMLCVHGGKHFWDRLAWLVDVAELIRAQPVDWALVMQIAAELKSTRVVLLGLSLAHELLEAPLPQSVLEPSLRNSTVRWLANTVQTQLRLNTDKTPSVIPRAIFRLRSRDTIGQGMRHMLRLTISPTERDRQTMRLPRALSGLYVLVRFWRLLGQYGLGLRQPFTTDLGFYDPTPQEVVEEMLRLADVRPGDILYDLGCGDGRIVVTAAERYGIRALGVDISPLRIAEANANARRHGVESLVRFLQEDAKKVNISEATVVILYLSLHANLKLVGRLRSELSPGARIVSRNARIYGWPPDCTEKHVLPNGIESTLYLWRIQELPRKGTTAKGAAMEG